MLSNLRIDTDARKINNLPDGWTTIFLARISAFTPFLFLAVVGPEVCAHSECALGGEVQVVLFTAESFRVYDVYRGQNNSFGGGIAEIIFEGTHQIIEWTTSDECGCYRFLDTRIPPDDVLVAL